MPIIEGTSDATLRQETNPCSALTMDDNLLLFYMLFSEELGKQKRKLSVTVVFSRDITF